MGREGEEGRPNWSKYFGHSLRMNTKYLKNEPKVSQLVHFEVTKSMNASDMWFTVVSFPIPFKE